MSIFKKRKGVKASEFASLHYQPTEAETSARNVEPAMLAVMESKPLWIRLYQNKKQAQPYSPVVMVRASDVQAIHPNVYDPDKADILVGGHWFATVHPFDEVARDVYGIDIESDNPDAYADWQRMKKDRKRTKE